MACLSRSARLPLQEGPSLGRCCLKGHFPGGDAGGVAGVPQALLPKIPESSPSSSLDVQVGSCWSKMAWGWASLPLLATGGGPEGREPSRQAGRQACSLAPLPTSPAWPCWKRPVGSQDGRGGLAVQAASPAELRGWCPYAPGIAEEDGIPGKPTEACLRGLGGALGFSDLGRNQASWVQFLAVKKPSASIPWGEAGGSVLLSHLPLSAGACPGPSTACEGPCCLLAGGPPEAWWGERPLALPSAPMWPERAGCGPRASESPAHLCGRGQT